MDNFKKEPKDVYESSKTINHFNGNNQFGIMGNNSANNTINFYSKKEEDMIKKIDLEELYKELEKVKCYMKNKENLSYEEEIQMFRVAEAQNSIRTNDNSKLIDKIKSFSEFSKNVISEIGAKLLAEIILKLNWIEFNFRIRNIKSQLCI